MAGTGEAVSREAWWDRHRWRLGDGWASQIEDFAADATNPAECKRRVGRYVLWCLTHDRDPTTPNDTLMSMYLEGTPKLEADEPMKGRTLVSVRAYVSGWQDWLQHSN